MWLTRYIFNTIKFRFERSSQVENRNRFQEASSKANITGMNANIAIIFLGNKYSEVGFLKVTDLRSKSRGYQVTLTLERT